MYVNIDLCLIPLGVGVSLSPYIAQCQRILKEAGLNHELHAYGTNIEGEWDSVFAAVKACHETVHAMGAARITSTVKIGTRIDRRQTLADKVTSVENCLSPLKKIGEDQ